jgi:hypothetical protein
MVSKQVMIILGLLYSKDSRPRNAVIIKKQDHDFALSKVNIIFYNLKDWDHKVMNGIQGQAHIMLETL